MRLGIEIVPGYGHPHLMQTRGHPVVTPRLIALFLGAITLALYLPALTHDFVQYDDQQYVTENARVTAGLTWKSFLWAFGFHASNWHPLAWLSHILDCQLYGLHAGGHHLTSVLLHTASSVLLFLVLNRMTGFLWRCACVAALFAWHPAHVESVAWIAERKDVLCAFFWMLTLWHYAVYALRGRARSYWASLGCFALCLMSKPMGITLPFVLLLLDFWPLCRTEKSPRKVPAWSLLREKIPFFILSAASGVLTVLAQRQAIVSTVGLPLNQRLAHTFIAYLHYLAIAFVPRHLAVYDPYDTNVPLVTVIFAAIILGLITILVVVYARRSPWFTTGWFWYLGTLVPVIGLVQVGDQAWADRYTYLPFIGIFIAAVWGAAELFSRERTLKWAAGAVAVAILVATSLQLSHWKNTRTLFEHAAAVTQKNYLAITLLGSMLAQDGKLDDAISHYHTALQFKPGLPEAYFFLGNALEKKGDLDGAVTAYGRALNYPPIAEQTHIFLAIVLARQNKYEEATAHYQAALKSNPDSAVAHNNLARLFHSQGRFDEAIAHYQAALELDPKLALAHNNLGILLLQKGQVNEGVRQLRDAVRLKPDNFESLHNLAVALNQQGQWAEAVELFKKTVPPASTDPQAHYDYATALAHLGKTRDAIAQYATALLQKQDFPAALDRLAWILATHPDAQFRNGSEAVKMAEQACALTDRKEPTFLKTLSATQAESGDFAKAAATAKEAREVALTTNRKELAELCGRLLDSFQASKPWRESSGK